MHSLTAVPAALLVLGLCTPASADFHMEYEDIIASIDAHAVVCSELDEESVRRTQVTLEKKLTEEQLQNLPCVRKTDIYKRTFQHEYNWLMSLTTKERQKACHHG
ncbi:MULTISPECIES: hypothetical protein [unclassified Janthinobacterium]|uniref:hypothetical protein n=1 Tax=unclassified Janthinobacterium TaxID=2610881 RepID=UPI001C55AD68|nr:MULTISPECIES: hypothetical protein [unclassified Janthinobacterium]QYG07377.1 hypothetical protein KY494_00650 [Janthinobacterium sp. PAMC25594]